MNGTGGGVVCRYGGGEMLGISARKHAEQVQALEAYECEKDQLASRLLSAQHLDSDTCELVQAYTHDSTRPFTHTYEVPTPVPESVRADHDHALG